MPVGIALVGLIIQWVQAGLAAAPTAIDIVTKGKAAVEALFGAKLITIEQQNVAHAHMDSIQAMALAGIIPPHWQVQPDPPAAP